MFELRYVEVWFLDVKRGLLCCLNDCYLRTLEEFRTLRFDPGG